MGTESSPQGDGGAGGQGDASAALPGSDTPEGTGDGASGDSKDDLRQVRFELSKWRKLANERDAELKKVQEATATDSEKAIATARKEGYDEAVGKYKSMLFAADVRAAAGGVLADPEDAAKLLDFDAIEVDGEGRPVSKSVKDALAALVKEKPYLAAKPQPGNGNGGGFGGSADQGARTTQVADASSWLRGLARSQTGR